MVVAEFTLETGNSSTKTRLSVNLRTGNSKLYGVFDELDVLLRFPTLFFGAILFINENVVPVFYRARSV